MNQVYKQTLLGIAAAILLSQSVFAAPTVRGGYRETGALHRSDYTANIFELARREAEARRASGGAHGLPGLNPEQTRLLNDLSTSQRGLMDRYNEAMREGTAPEARRRALEDLHRDFWRVLDEQTTEGAMGRRYTPQAMTDSFAGIFRAYRTPERVRTDAVFAASLERSLTHMDAIHQTATVRRNAVHEASAAAERLHSPQMLEDAISILRENNEPTTVSAVQHMFEMLNQAHEGTLPGMEGRGWAHDSPQMRELKGVVDFVLATGGSNRDLWDITNVVTQMMRQPNGVESLHGMTALFGGSNEALLTGARAKYRELTRSTEHPNGLELEAGLSSRGAVERVKEVLNERLEQAKTARPVNAERVRELERELAQFERHNQELATRAMVESMARINQRHARSGLGKAWETIKDLFNKNRRPPCVPCAAMLFVGSAAFLASVDQNAEIPADQKMEAKQAYCFARATGANTFQEGTDMSVCQGVTVPVPTESDNPAPHLAGLGASGLPTANLSHGQTPAAPTTGGAPAVVTPQAPGPVGFRPGVRH